MNFYKTARRMVLAGGLTLALAPAAAANTIVVEPTPDIGPFVAGSYLWSYTVSLEGNATIETGDFFTILDFTGFVPASQSVNAGWTASSNNTGQCTTNVSNPIFTLIQAVCIAADDPAIPNLTWTRTGAPIVQGGGTSALGEFSARSIYNLPTNSGWFSQDRDNQQGISDEPAAGQTNVPVIPEPASMMLLGTGLASVAGAIRRRRQAAKAQA